MHCLIANRQVTQIKAILNHLHYRGMIECQMINVSRLNPRRGYHSGNAHSQSKGIHLGRRHMIIKSSTLF